MIPIYICDDQAEIRDYIAQTIQKQVFISSYDMGPIFPVGSSREFFEVYQQTQVPAIYFLDVDLKEGDNGFQLASKIRDIDPLGYIVFITSHGDLSFETFRYRLQALDYIEKQERTQIAERIGQCLETINQYMAASKANESSYYSVKIFNSIRHIPLDDILFFEADGKNHRILLNTSSEIIEFFGSLNTVENELGTSFFRSHRSFLVNRNKITSINLAAQTVILTGDVECPLSRNAKKSLKESF